MPSGCGCAGNSCGCSITAGPGLTIEGTGNASAPFIISLAPTPDDIPVAVDGDLDLTSAGGYSVVSVTLAANATDILLPTQQGRIDIVFTQANGGGWTVTWPAAILWQGGTAPVITATDGSVDWVALVNANGTWVGTRVAADAT